MRKYHVPSTIAGDASMGSLILFTCSSSNVLPAFSTPIGTVTMTPYGSVEPTWDSVDDDIARYRFQLGSEVVLAHGFTLNAYYAYQLDRFSATSNVHGIGAILMMYL